MRPQYRFMDWTKDFWTPFNCKMYIYKCKLVFVHKISPLLRTPMRYYLTVVFASMETKKNLKYPDCLLWCFSFIIYNFSLSLLQTNFICFVTLQWISICLKIVTKVTFTRQMSSESVQYHSITFRILEKIEEEKKTMDKDLEFFLPFLIVAAVLILSYLIILLIIYLCEHETTRTFSRQIRVRPTSPA